MLVITLSVASTQIQLLLEEGDEEEKRGRDGEEQEAGKGGGGGSGGDSELCSRDALRANFTDLRNNWVQALNVIDSFPLSLSSPPCSAFPWVDIVLK